MQKQFQPTAPDGGIKPLFLSVKETRKRLSLGHTSVYALIKSGRLKSCLFGRKRLVEAASVEALAKELLSTEK